MERKKRSKGRGWESCYVEKIYGTFGVAGRNWSNFAHTHTHTHAAKLVVEIIKNSIVNCSHILYQHCEISNILMYTNYAL